MQRNNIYPVKSFIILLLLVICVRINSRTALAQNDSSLPLVVIDTRGEEIPDKPKIISWLKVIDNGHGLLNNQFQAGTDYEGYAGIEIRGQSSQMFPKMSYSIELRKDNVADSSVSLLGMPAESDWVLYAPYSDKSMMRNALTFHLGSKMGAWQPRYRFCEVYLNGEYSGVYMLMESIKRDSNRVNISKLKADEISGDDLTGGYIIKADKTADLSKDEYFQIFPSIHYLKSTNYKFTYVYPKYDEIVPEQRNYVIKYLTDTENSINSNSFSDLQNGFRKYIDVKSFIDFQIIQEITNNVDGYRFSAFFYKDKDSKGGKLRAGPLWDFDLCYGNEDYTDFNLQTNIWLYSKFTDEYGGRMHWWARMMQDNSYRSVFITRWKELRKGPFSNDSVMAFLDNTVGSLGESIGRNFEKWPIIGEYVWPNYFVGDTYEQEVDYLKGWLTERLDWIDANIMLADGSGNASKKDILVFPNPVKDRMNLYFYSAGIEKIRIEIFDFLGQKVFDREASSNGLGFQYIDLDIYPVRSGFYILKVTQGERLIGKKNVIVTGR